MQELPFLHSARRLMLIDICLKLHEDSLRGFQVTERTRIVTDRRTDRQTDRQTDRRTDARGKTICLPTLRGGGRPNEPFIVYFLTSSLSPDIGLTKATKYEYRIKIIFKRTVVHVMPIWG